MRKKNFIDCLEKTLTCYLKLNFRETQRIYANEKRDFLSIFLKKPSQRPSHPKLIYYLSLTYVNVDWNLLDRFRGVCHFFLSFYLRSVDELEPFLFLLRL